MGRLDLYVGVDLEITTRSIRLHFSNEIRSNSDMFITLLKLHVTPFYFYVIIMSIIVLVLF